MLGSHTVMVWSSTQGVVALSSGEAELYALTKGAANTLGMISLAMDFGMHLDGRAHSDASAAIGMVNRTGAGKLRHVRVQYLWIQDMVRRGELGVSKVLGDENPADLLTKHVDANLLRRHAWRLGFEVLADRAASAPTLSALLSLLQNTGDPNDEGARTTFHARAQEAPWVPAREGGRGDRNADAVVGVAQEDCWSRDGVFVVRERRRARTELFTPLHVSGSPTAKGLTPTRVTEGRFADGTTFRRVDAWRCSTNAHLPLGRPWCGRTLFLERNSGTIHDSHNTLPTFNAASVGVR